MVCNRPIPAPLARGRSLVAWGALSRAVTVLGAIFVAHLCDRPVLHGQEASEKLKQAQATRVSAGAIRIDGILAETVWQTATPVTDFIQKEPVEGAEPTDRMEVRVVYDDTALYIGARMFSSGAIQAPLSRRDDGEQVEYIQIELDT